MEPWGVGVDVRVKARCVGKVGGFNVREGVMIQVDGVEMRGREAGAGEDWE